MKQKKKPTFIDDVIKAISLAIIYAFFIVFTMAAIYTMATMFW